MGQILRLANTVGFTQTLLVHRAGYTRQKIDRLLWGVRMCTSVVPSLYMSVEEIPPEAVRACVRVLCENGTTVADIRTLFAMWERSPEARTLEGTATTMARLRPVIQDMERAHFRPMLYFKQRVEVCAKKKFRA